MSRARYAELASYQDSGEAEYRLPDITARLPPELRGRVRREDYEKPQVIRFRSWFRRPQDLRFEWVSHHPYPPFRHLDSFNAIWAGRGGAFKRMSFDAETRSCPRGLGEAVASATGVSHGTAYHFATFFVSGSGRAAPLALLPLAGVQEVDIEGVACWQVTTRRAGRSPDLKASQEKSLTEMGLKPEAIERILADRARDVTLSIAKGDGLLRRIQEGSSIETRRNIQVNPTLPDDLFENGPKAHMPFDT